MSEEVAPVEAGRQEPAIDPVQLEYVRQQLASEQNLLLGALTGLVASLAGAAVWAVVTVATGYQIGFMAIGVGVLVGLAVRAAGKGMTAIYGVLGAVLALAGCALGNLMAVTALVAGGEGVAFLDAVVQLNPPLVQELMVAFFSPMDVLFYAIAAYEGHQLSFRKLDSEELQRRMGGPSV